MEEQCLAVDIGGTKIAAGLVDRSGRLSEMEVVPTPRSEQAEVLWNELAALVHRVLRGSVGSTCVVCGVGCGGPMNAGGSDWSAMTVSPLNIPAWRGFPLRSAMSDLTGLPTFVDNDAKALAMGERWIGAAAGCDDFIGMVVSTGVGGGIFLDGRLLHGRLGNAGHIGHMIVEPNGRPCWCGSRGCLEAEASGTAIAAITGRPPAEATLDVIERSGTMVGRAIASVASLLDLQLAVVSGSVALGFGKPFFAAASAEIERAARIEFARGTQVVPGALGSSGPLIGAGAVGWSHYQAHGFHGAH